MLLEEPRAGLGPANAIDLQRGIVALEGANRGRGARPELPVDGAGVVAEVAQARLDAGGAFVGRVVDRVEVANLQRPAVTVDLQRPRLGVDRHRLLDHALTIGGPRVRLAID